MIVCGAKTRAGSPCQRPAGWGTDHAGKGRCKLHGGNAGAPIKHGRYSKVLPQKIQARLQLLEDSDPLDLIEEVNIQRALFADYIARFDDAKLTASDIQFMFNWLNDISRMVERIVKIRNESALTAAEVAYLAARIPEVVTRYVDDTEKQRAFVRELLSITSGAD